MILMYCALFNEGLQWYSAPRTLNNVNDGCMLEYTTKSLIWPCERLSNFFSHTHTPNFLGCAKTGDADTNELWR